jgi:biotin carboxyl carrier protein
VRTGEAPLVFEAMKMEMQMGSPFDSTVDQARFAVGDQIATGRVLATIRE